MERIETVIIGAGQAGLAASYCLSQLGREHVVLERGRLGESWRSGRWDSFTLVSPNWAIELPGAPPSLDPDGFMPRDAIVGFLEEYATSFGAPVRSETPVQALRRLDDERFQLTTGSGAIEARNVIVATGPFQQGRIPGDAHAGPAGVLQLHSGDYRNPERLPPGAVLVVGNGQSGVQIAEELVGAGREVYLSVGGCGWLPRRYRGRDVFWWLTQIGFFDRTPDQLPSPRARFMGAPQLSGTQGGHAVHARLLSERGVHLLGRVAGIEGDRLRLFSDLAENLEKADKFAADALALIDRAIAARGIEAPAAEPEQFAAPTQTQQPAFKGPEELGLVQAGVKTIIWATGYRFDFSWIDLPIFDPDGFPLHQRGVTEVPGLYVLGLPWLHRYRSSLLLGIGEDAEYLAAHIAARDGR